MKKFSALTVVLAILVLGSPAIGLSLPPQTLTFGFFDNPGSQMLNFNQFDDNGGLYLLTKVTLELNATQGANITGENDTEAPGSIAANLNGTVSATGGGLSATALLSTSDGPYAVGATDYIPGSGPDFYDFGFISDTESDTDILTDPPDDLSPFIGLGTIGIDIAGSGGFSISGVTNSTNVVTEFGNDGSATITYEYTVVPEPATIGMLATGALGMFGVILRRRK
jgi:hypothetical protein